MACFPSPSVSVSTLLLCLIFIYSCCYMYSLLVSLSISLCFLWSYVVEKESKRWINREMERYRDRTRQCVNQGHTTDDKTISTCSPPAHDTTQITQNKITIQGWCEVQKDHFPAYISQYSSYHTQYTHMYNFINVILLSVAVVGERSRPQDCLSCNHFLQVYPICLSVEKRRQRWFNSSQPPLNT